jgi:hypothetical protein
VDEARVQISTWVRAVDDAALLEGLHELVEGGIVDVQQYDPYKGITDLTSDEANLDVSYNQDTISENRQLFFKSLNSEPSERRADTDSTVAESWMASIDGEMETPIEMTVPELVEKFSSKSFIMKQGCIESATANAWIYQA